MLFGIDVSSHNGYPLNSFTKQGYNKSDFVIVKATQGVGYVNPYCDKVISDCKKDGKLWGYYHYAGGNKPKDEARYFYEHTKGYTLNGVPVLDFEQYQNKAWNNYNWAFDFITEYYSLTNVYPLIYIQASAIARVKNCAPYCGLWVASYQSKLTWDVSPWKTWTLWQYTSNNEKRDDNKGNITKEGWLKLANPKGVTKPVTSENFNYTGNITKEQALERLAYAVINGEFGNGSFRKSAIYNAVQSHVNAIVSKGE